MCRHHLKSWFNVIPYFDSFADKISSTEKLATKNLYFTMFINWIDHGIVCPCSRYDYNCLKPSSSATAAGLKSFAIINAINSAIFLALVGGRGGSRIF